jgi:hypothetical protein
MKTKKRVFSPAGSILPVALYNGKLFFLFGKENDLEDSAKGWSDFGGGCENNDLPIDTAIREAAEEMTGFLGQENDIRKMVNHMGTYNITVGTYHVHILVIQYDEKLPFYYNNNHAFLWNKMDKKLLNKTKLFEKIEMKWFSVDEMKTHKSSFRGFYQKIVDEILLHIPKIKKMVVSKTKTKKTKLKKLFKTKTIKIKMKGG